MKKNEKKIWFRNKNYGWGWYPSSKEGWVVLGIFIALMLIWASQVEYATPAQLPWYWLALAVLLGVLFGVCFHFGEKPEWRWGGKPLLTKKK
mgnify:CR=1 FL=1